MSPLCENKAKCALQVTLMTFYLGTNDQALLCCEAYQHCVRRHLDIFMLMCTPFIISADAIGIPSAYPVRSLLSLTEE